MRKEPRVFVLGQQSVLLEWEGNPSMELLEYILAAEDALTKHISAIAETQVVYRSLCVHFDRNIDSVDLEEIRAQSVFPAETKSHPRRIWRIPVCYSPQYGPDLQESAKKLGMSVEELIRAHCQTVYPVYGLGFLPGFLYLGDVPEGLQLPRKSEPRMEVVAGTVALAEKQTGIYPQTSPGGWQLLGRTPIRLFDPQQTPPCSVRVGDGIEFYPIDRSTFSLIEIQVQQGLYRSEIREVP